MSIFHFINVTICPFCYFGNKRKLLYLAGFILNSIFFWFFSYKKQCIFL